MFSMKSKKIAFLVCLTPGFLHGRDTTCAASFLSPEVEEIDDTPLRFDIACGCVPFMLEFEYIPLIVGPVNESDEMEVGPLMKLKIESFIDFNYEFFFTYLKG